MADEPRNFDPTWTDPTEPGQDPIPLGDQEPTPTTGVPPSSLPPPLKGDEGIAVDYDGYAYVIRMDFDEADPVHPGTPGLWTGVVKDGLFYKVDFSALYSQIQGARDEFSGTIETGLLDIQTTLLNDQTAWQQTWEGRQTTYEGTITGRVAAFEIAQNNRQTLYENNATTSRQAFQTQETSARQAFEAAQVAARETFEDEQQAARLDYEGSLTARQGDFEAAEAQARTSFTTSEAAARQAFQTAQTTRQQDFETAELQNRAVFEQGVNTALGAQDAQIAALQASWAAYQTDINGRVTAAETTANEAKTIAQQAAAGVIADSSVTPQKLSQETLDLIASGGSGAATWDTLAGKPATFPPAPHRHPWSDLDDVPAFAPADHTHTWDSVTDKPTQFPPSLHSHSWGTITLKPTTFPPSAHRHAWADLDNVPATFAPAAHTHAWTDIADKPATFAPSAHTHSYNDLTDKPAIPGSRIDFSIFAAGKPLAGELLYSFVSHIPWTLPMNMVGSRASVGVNPTASASFSLKKNGTSIGSITISTAGVVTLGTFGAGNQAFVAGDVMSITAPTTQDATLADFSLSLYGTR
jgi:hypothetical protein